MQAAQQARLRSLHHWSTDEAGAQAAIASASQRALKAAAAAHAAQALAQSLATRLDTAATLVVEEGSRCKGVGIQLGTAITPEMAAELVK
jgi:hypothetical protein